ncbi:MAG: ParA family protein [Myxococcota bacterium]|nr:ParA family protein [Myxococcota bacterium]
MKGSLGVRSLLSAGLNRIMATDTSVRVTGRRAGHVMAVAAQKGGVGKTTTTVNLACALAHYEHKRVLIIDIDAQGHVASSLRENVPSTPTRLSDILLSETPRDLMDAAAESDIDGVWMTGPDKQLSVTDTLLSSRVGREYVLKGALANARSHFDVILIDCPPNLGNLTLNALVAADSVLIPCDMSILAFEGVADLLGTVQTVNVRLGQQLDIFGIVRTRVDGRTRQINDAVEGALKDNYSDYLLRTVVPINSALAKAQAAGLSIFQFQPKSRGALAYRGLAAEVSATLAQIIDGQSARNTI